jgi:hypothetical protein
VPHCPTFPLAFAIPLNLTWTTERGMLSCAAAYLPPYENNLELMRIPHEIWPGLEANLKVQENFVVAWLQAGCTTFPGRSLNDLMQSEKRFFPAFLESREGTDSILVSTTPSSWDAKHKFYALLGLLIDVFWFQGCPPTWSTFPYYLCGEK